MIPAMFRLRHALPAAVPHLEQENTAMTPSALSAFLAFTLITAFTPGPNTMLSLSTGVRRGFAGSVPVLLGIGTGFLCVMFLCGALVDCLSSLSQTFMTVMKYAGCLYIAWLAWHIATAGEGDTGTGPGGDFVRGLLLQFVNVKIYMYGMTAFSGFLFPWSESALLPGTLVLTLIGSAGTVTWALIGSTLQGLFRRHARLMNAVMALLLLACLVPLLFNV